MENNIKIYVPSFNDNQCVVVLNKDTIRVYDSIILNENNSYIDYYVNSHYLSNAGNILLTEPVNCLDKQSLTTDFYYRNDLSHILVSFLIILIICFYLPFKIICRFWRRLK